MQCSLNLNYQNNFGNCKIKFYDSIDSCNADSISRMYMAINQGRNKDIELSHFYEIANGNHTVNLKYVYGSDTDAEFKPVAMWSEKKHSFKYIAGAEDDNISIIPLSVANIAEADVVNDYTELDPGGEINYNAFNDLYMQATSKRQVLPSRNGIPRQTEQA